MCLREKSVSRDDDSIIDPAFAPDPAVMEEKNAFGGEKREGCVCDKESVCMCVLHSPSSSFSLHHVHRLHTHTHTYRERPELGEQCVCVWMLVRATASSSCTVRGEHDAYNEGWVGYARVSLPATILLSLRRPIFHMTWTAMAASVCACECVCSLMHLQSLPSLCVHACVCVSVCVTCMRLTLPENVCVCVAIHLSFPTLLTM